MSKPTPLTGRCVWHGADLAPDGDWIWRWPDEATAQLDAALAHAKSQGRSGTAIRHEDFPLTGLKDFITSILEELEDGRGLVRLRGFPVERYSEDDLRSVFWGLGLHLGTIMPQTIHGEWLGEVRNETRDNVAVGSEISAHRGKGEGELPVLSSRARARSNGPLRFHTDGSDVIGLLCARTGAGGGVSRVVSIANLYNQILARRPDLHALLCQDYYRRRPANEVGGSDVPMVTRLPIFGVRDGKLSCQYSRTFVEQAQELSEVPKMSAAQNEALDLIADLAEEYCLESPFEPGDLQLLNNHVIFHGRTPFRDDVEGGNARLLLRLWFSVANSRPLPDGFDRFWGNTASGSVRGGVRMPADARPPTYAQ